MNDTNHRIISDCFSSFVETQIDTTMKNESLKWYQNITQRRGIWEHLTSPIYILIVLFFSILFTSVGLLSIIWYPWVLYVVGDDAESGKSM